MGTISEIGNLLPKEWVNDLVIEVDGIRILALDKNIDKYTCSAQIKITDMKAAKPTGEVAALGLIYQELSSEGVVVVYTIESMADNPKETRVEMHGSEQLQQSLIMLGAMRQKPGIHALLQCGNSFIRLPSPLMRRADHGTTSISLLSAK
jgi:hypothetical protein